VTAETAFLSTQLPRHPPPRSRMYTEMAFLITQLLRHPPPRSHMYTKMVFLSTQFPRRPPLVHSCTEVHRFSQRNPSDVDYLSKTDVSKCV
jgi:hypothetical protein